LSSGNTSYAKTFAAGIHKINANYLGNGSYLASTDQKYVQVLVDTATVLTVDDENPVISQNITLTATVTATAGTATGYVNFIDNGLLFSTVLLASGVAQYSTNNLQFEVSHSFTADYSATGNFKDSTSFSIEITVT